MLKIFKFCQKISKSVSVLILQNKIEAMEKDLLEITQELSKLQIDIKELYKRITPEDGPVVIDVTELKKSEESKSVSDWVK